MSALKVSNSGTVPVYTVSGASTSRQLPTWNSARKKNWDQSQPLELLQDFGFNKDGHSVAIRISEDGQWVVSTGAYKPQIHVHDVKQLSLSFSRHTEALNHTFELISPDYSKSIHLQTDRSVEFHTPGGCHYRVRLPRFGRDLVYDRRSTEVLIPSVGLDENGSGEVFRLNLEVGRFMRSYNVDVGADDGVERGLQGSIGVGAVNTGAIAENSHGLLAFGTTIGTVEFWDPRSKARVATLQNNDGAEITALSFLDNGLSFATGSSSGLVRLYDMRQPAPLLQKDQGFGYPIKKILPLTTAAGEKKILTADQRIIRIFDESTGAPFVSIEPEVEINDVAIVPKSGMILSANEGPAQHAWFVPALGPAPAWCSFLDNMTDEMAEEARTGTYDNFRFLTMPELRSLSLAHLVGKTNLLRPYMHGYFVASKLYDQARLIANPYVWEEERMKRVKEKADKERESRIRSNKKVKVNQKLVDRLLKKQENRVKVDTEAGLLGDDRFKSLFEDEDFKVDELSAEFRSLNPSTRVEGKQRPNPNDSDDDGQPKDAASEDEDSDGQRPIRKTGSDMVMRVSSSRDARKGKRDTALGSRVEKPGRASKPRQQSAFGDREVTFVPEAEKKDNKATAPKPAIKQRRSASANTFRKL